MIFFVKTPVLNKHSDIPPERRFQLALLCGENLPALDLSHFRELDNDKLKTLQKACPNLRSLNLSHTPIETLDLSILNDFSKLEKLDVSWTLIETLDKLPKKNLKELNLNLCHELTAQELKKLQSFPQLEKLNVSFTAIKTLGKLPKSLKVLHLSGCTSLLFTEQEIKTLSSFANLQWVYLPNPENKELISFLSNLYKQVTFK